MVTVGVPKTISVRAVRDAALRLLQEAALGAWVGLWFLGVGGRIAMRIIAITIGQTPTLNAGGTVSVVAAGAGAGALGAVLNALSRALAARFGRGNDWVRLALFAALLALVTARGLHGSPGPVVIFWPLVTLYGATLDRILTRRRSRLAGHVIAIDA